MGLTITVDLGSVAHSLALPLVQVESVVRLLDAGNTVPFITRYRKDQTGGLDEEQIRQVEGRVGRLRMLAERKQTILRSIEGQGKLTPELAAAINAADSTKRLEDLYLPYKPKKQSLATLARQRQLEPLAHEVLSADPAAADLDARARDFINTDRQVLTSGDALLGVGHILAEDFSERVELRERLRKTLKRTGKLVCAKTEIADKQGKEFLDYFEFQEQLGKIPPHRILAINRGEKAKMLRVRIDADGEEMARMAEQLFVPPEHPHADFLRGCVRDALARLVAPSLEREIRREMTEFAETHAVEVFAKNLRNLLLQPPVRNRRALAVDPGFKSGCKLAVLDEFGNLLDHSVVHLIGKAERKAESRAKLVELIKQHNVSVVALGNGTACRETEQVLAELMADELKDSNVAYVIVNEAGASVYSTSPLGREELPNYDATLRGAISIGRRMQDPLSELVKIDPANIGVGLYQHDVKAKHLRTSLDAVVESCVNYVGVDLNTASPALLRYVSGLNQLTARRLYDHRTANGPFKSREQLKEVSGFGDATFVQAAGFLKIGDGENPLDGTWIHPESYDVARRVLERLGGSPAELTRKESAGELAQKTAELNVEELAGVLQVGPLTLADVVSQLSRPGRDPREDLPPPIFKTGILKLEDLAPGMELYGSVLNVVDFGAFVDIGLRDSGLVHVSQLANRYIRDPHEVAAVGDIVKVWVIDVDKTRRRVSLTMIPPGSKRQEPAGRGHGGRAHSDRSNGQRADGQRTDGQRADGQRADGQRPDGQPVDGPRGDGRGQHRRGQRPQRGARSGSGAPNRPATGAAPNSEGAASGDSAASNESDASTSEVSSGASNVSGAATGQAVPPPHAGAGSHAVSHGGAGPGHSRSPQGRKPYGGGPHGRHSRGPDQPRPAYRPAPKPKPVIPITDAMKKGKEPLRTFGDLKQFFEIKSAPPAESATQASATQASATQASATQATAPPAEMQTAPAEMQTAEMQAPVESPEESAAKPSEEPVANRPEPPVEHAVADEQKSSS